MFTESNVMMTEIEWQKIPNSASVVEAEISSELVAYNDYHAELIYQTHFATLRAKVAFSKCYIYFSVNNRESVYPTCG